MAQRPRTFWSDFRKFFGRGLAVLLPSVLTLWLLWTAFVFVFNTVAEPINRGIRGAIVWTTPLVVPDRSLPAWARVSDSEVESARRAADAGSLRDAPPERVKASVRTRNFKAFWDDHWYFGGAGFAVAIVLIYLAGLTLGGLIGRRMYSRLEALIKRVPGFKQIYPHVKQVVDLVMGDKPMAFKRVVLVEYPSAGIWTLGLVTSSSMRAIGDRAGEPCVTVFIPSTPTPFTGFAISVPESRVVDLPISIDEAIRFVLTGGVLVPERQVVGVSSPAVAELTRRISESDPARPAGTPPPGGPPVA